MNAVTNGKFISLLICLLSFSLIISSCTEEQLANLKTKPTALGRANKLLVIADDSMWETSVKDTFQKYYEAPFMVLPRPEPIFVVNRFPSRDFIDVRKQLRNILIVADLSDANSPSAQLMSELIGQERVEKSLQEDEFGYAMARDVWAMGQQVFYLFGKNETVLKENVKRYYPTIKKQINAFDEKKIRSMAYVTGISKTTSEKVQEKTGITMVLPKDFYIAVHEDKTIWLRSEAAQSSSNIIIHESPYLAQSQLTMSGVKALRNKLGKKFITSETRNAYMITDDVHLPLINKIGTFNNYYSIEVRGLWKMQGDFMGGPFLSYAIHQPEKNNILFIDAFIYAPGKEKRELMQQLEYICQTIR